MILGQPPMVVAGGVILGVVMFAVYAVLKRLRSK